MKPHVDEKTANQADADGGSPQEKALPAYLSSQDVDYLVRMNMALLSELWITRDRLAILEETLAKNGAITRQEIDGHQPSAEFSDYLDSLRAVVVESVLGAPFRSTETVESLVEKGKHLADLHQRKP